MVIFQNSPGGKSEIFLDLGGLNGFHHWNRFAKSSILVEFRQIPRLS